MAALGAVFHDPDFVFQDGQHGNKLLIVLAVGEICTVARTTSKPSGKSRSYGCHVDDRYPNFFIPREATLFREDTWVCLDYLVDFNHIAFASKVTAGAMHKITELGLGLLLDLLECAIAADDISADQERRLRLALAQVKAVHE